jgi:multidrug efflux pump subunit AcrB
MTASSALMIATSWLTIANAKIDLNRYTDLGKQKSIAYQLVDSQKAVIAYNNVLVRSQITGKLIKICFHQGQTVRKGDVLAVIDPSPYQAQLDQAIANRDRDQAHLAILLTIQRQPGTNVIETVNRIKAMMPVLQASIPPGVKINVVSDRTQTRVSMALILSLVIARTLTPMMCAYLLKPERSTRQ